MTTRTAAVRRYPEIARATLDYEGALMTGESAGDTTVAGDPTGASSQRLLRRTVWAAGLAGLTLISLAATVQLGRLLAAQVRRWPAGAGPGGAAVLIGFVVLAVVLVALPHSPAGHRRSPRSLLAFGLVLTFAVRLVVVALIESPLPVDGVAYREMAVGILNGACCFDERPSGLPMALALPYAVSGPVDAVHEALNVLAGVAGGWFLYAIVRVEWNDRAAAAALAGYALTPSLALLTPVLLTETLFTTLVLGSLYAAQRAASGPRPWLAAAYAGVLVAASQYVRPFAPLLLPAVLLLPLLTYPTLRHGAAVAALICLALGVGVLPIASHNLEAHHDLSISSSSFGGATLYIGTTAETNGRTSSALATEIRTLPGSDQWERSKTAQRIAIRRILDDPASFAALALRKFPIMWGNDEEGARFAFSRLELRRPLGATLHLISQAAYLAIVVGALAGLWMMRPRLSPMVVAIAFLVVGTIALHTFVEVKPRYHAWLIPLFLVLAAPALDAALRRLGNRSWRRTAATEQDT